MADPVLCCSNCPIVVFVVVMSSSTIWANGSSNQHAWKGSTLSPEDRLILEDTLAPALKKCQSKVQSVILNSPCPNNYTTEKAISHSTPISTSSGGASTTAMPATC